MNEEAIASLDQLIRELRRWARRCQNMMPVWPKVGNYIARLNRMSFATRGASTGEPWHPLSASTLRQKGRRAWLVQSGAMKAEFTGRPMGVERYSLKNAQFGASSQVAIWQQFGTHRNGKRHIPPRTIQKIKRGDRKEIAQMILDHITD